MSKLTIFRNKDPKEVVKLLSLVSSSLLPNPGIDDIIHQTGADPEFVKAVLGEIREQLHVSEGDESVKAHSRIYAFLSNEISRAALANADVSKIKARLGNRGDLQPSQYEVEFRDHFEVSEIFGERKPSVLEAVTRPDKVTNLRASHLQDAVDPRVTISLKSITPKRVEDRFSLIIISFRNGRRLEVECAFRAYIEDVDVREANDPLNVLKSFIDTYGLTFRFGDAVGKFMYNELVSLGRDDLSRPPALSIRPVEGQKGDYYFPFFTGATTSFIGSDGGLMTAVVLSFALNVTKYMATLRRHHVQLTPENMWSSSFPII